MGQAFTKFLLPLLLLVSSGYFLYTAARTGAFVNYFMSALFLGMTIASVQRAWGGGDGE